jgi:putative heme-binding domain-containing protein
MCARERWLAAFVVFALCRPLPLGAQQHETAQDVDDGGRVFRDTCANCHGPDGDEIAGIDLNRGVFRRAKTDRDLVEIIRNGVAGTAMPATNMSEEQAEQIVAYLRSVAPTGRSSSGTRSVERGKLVFETKGACLTCHRVNGVGSRSGPDLSDIGRLRRAIELETSIVDPNAEIFYTNRSYHVVAKDGTSVTGRLLNVDTFTIQLLDTKEQLRSFEKAGLRDYGFLAASPMPSFRGKLTEQEIADAVSYLVSLKGSK